MNIFTVFEEHITSLCQSLIEQGGILAIEDIDTSKIVVELPRDEAHGDLACNAAMVLSKQLGMKPRALAQILAEELDLRDDVATVEIAGPGFINIRLVEGRWASELSEILDEGTDYGRDDIGARRAVNIEFVSANPTGPLHAAHARVAVFGDALANLLSWTNFKVTREYYINDAGAQVEVLAQSVLLRYKEACGEGNIEIGEGLYPGEYLKDVGVDLKKIYGKNLLKMAELDSLPIIRKYTIDAMMALIKTDLADFGVKMDVYTSECQLLKENMVDEFIENIKADGHVYDGVLPPPKGQIPDDWEEREQLLFRSTDFGDDVDRPLKKSDGSWTYFATDIIYHMDKLDRTRWSKLQRTKGSELKRTNSRLINIWGADHGGYVKRMKGVVQILSGQDGLLDIKLCQLVTLLDKGKPVKMSKRAGNFITLHDVLEAVGSDVMRFIMLTRSNDQTLEFDYAKVTEKSRENPAFYVQYAHARAHSVLRQKDIPVLKNMGIYNSFNSDLTLLIHPLELRLIKQLVSWPILVRSAALSREPHKIAFYLIDLAALFHGLWNAGRDDPSLRFIQTSNTKTTLARLNLVQATAHVLKAGLNILSVTAPKEM